MRGDTERVQVGCAGPALQGREGSPRARRVDVGSKIMLRQQRRRGARKERVEVVAGEEVVETYRPHEEAGLHPLEGCSRRREVDELEETAPARILVSAPAAKGGREVS